METFTLQYHQVTENHICQHSTKCLSTAHSEDMPGLPWARVGGCEMRQGSSASQDKLRRSGKIKTQSQGLKLILSSLCCLQVDYLKGKMRYNWVVLALYPVLSLLVSSSSFSLCLFLFFFMKLLTVSKWSVFRSYKEIPVPLPLSHKPQHNNPVGLIL